jgi:arylsulfatase A-like enzyme
VAKKGALLEDTQLLDIVPTVLAVLGLPPSQEMPGRVIKEALEPGAMPAVNQKPVEAYGPVGSGWWRLIQSLLL